MGNGCTMINNKSNKSPGSAKGGALCFGHPLLDMMTPVQEAFLQEYDLVSGSVNLARPEQVPVFQRIVDEFGDAVTYVPGGAAMNTARFLSWMRPDMTVSYVGALGDDRFGTVLKSSLASAGVRPLFEEHVGKPTGTCACFVVDKDRCLLANLGAAVDLSRAWIDSPEVWQAVEEAEIYYAEGFFLNTASSPDGLLAVAKHARKAGKLFCFNLNAPYISGAFKDRIDAIMPYIDILFGSAEDIAAFAAVEWPKEFAEPMSPSTDNQISSSTSETTNQPAPGAPRIDEDGLETITIGDDVMSGDVDEGEEKDRLLRAVARIVGIPSAGGSRMVVATCGAGSTIISRKEGTEEVAVPRMRKEEIVDLNGAGDAFVGGFLAQYALTRDVTDSATVGHATAQNCIRNNGAVFGGTPPSFVQCEKVAKSSEKPKAKA